MFDTVFAAARAARRPSSLMASPFEFMKHDGSHVQCLSLTHVFTTASQPALQCSKLRLRQE